MTIFKFLVQSSSSPSTYQTTFEFDGKNLTAFCTCGGGDKGQTCHHRTDILNGDSSKIVSDNKNEIAELLQVFKDSPLDIKLRQLEDELQQQVQIKKQVETTKKEILKIMYGR